MMHIKLYNK